jgi:hypothetical protein
MEAKETSVDWVIFSWLLAARTLWLGRVSLGWTRCKCVEGVDLGVLDIV